MPTPHITREIKNIMVIICFFTFLLIIKLYNKYKTITFVDNPAIIQNSTPKNTNPAHSESKLLKEILKGIINVIKIFAAAISGFFAEKYGVLGYLEKEHFANEKYHETFLKDIEEEIRRNSKAPFVCNFRENYEGGKLPIYAMGKAKKGKK